MGIVRLCALTLKATSIKATCSVLDVMAFRHHGFYRGSLLLH